MKKIFTLLFTSFLIISCTKEKQGNVHFTGRVDGLKQGIVYIKKIKDTTLITLDSIVFDGSSDFDTRFNLSEPEMLYLQLNRGETNSIDNNLEIFFEPGEIALNTTLKHFYSDAEIKGSKNHEIFKKYLKIKSTLNDENLDLTQKEFNNLKINNPTVKQEIESKREKLLVRKYLYTANYALVNKQYETAPYITLTEIPDANLQLLDTIQKTMSPKVAKSKYGKRLTEWINERKKTEQ